MLIYILFFIGFVLLIKGAEFLVEAASALAKTFGISDMVIGLTIVSIGTSLPELIVNLLASAQGNVDIAIGNVYGSNIANVLLILGMSAIIRKLPLSKDTVIAEIPFSMAAIMIVGFLGNAEIWGANDTLEGLSRYDGMTILFFFFLFFAYIVMTALNDRMNNKEEKPEKLNVLREWSLILAGIAMLFFGGKWVVDGAVHFATLLGMSQAFIGLTIVAIGTSLPEMMTSIVAARKGNVDVAVGNVVGSNIFNLLWILGLSAVISPLPMNKANNFDAFVVLLASTLIVLLMIISRKLEVKSWHGVVYILAYCVYVMYLLARG
ncbi:MAG: calcium/sodium antiporter [Saprospiraceae bacterium]|nr:calcium/sodium antiporter [Saprospiraceae bacterium]MBK7524330.1 calcium/sodium antiporter [Saprospiraceae bacterium]MBK8372750.1 calcium/sodium antiporter [Saprospiraceae bacterium]MBK8820910.1 calcium/sodium antiporter [Saprospiraceae bacterium]MBK8855468.1 calcium/sodium antiporter [Saprospiraceae bacterium]